MAQAHKRTEKCEGCNGTGSKGAVTVTLTLTEKEASTLQAILGRVAHPGFSADNPGRQTSAIYNALNAAGVEIDRDAYTGMKAFTLHYGKVSVNSLSFDDRKTA